ncbi:hypothetical protein [Wansuia hejianensis]|uniref:Uncharacterized protein n=1 Tax=Wansuia hejianensis TaxID=2763667 RepID=A0A926EXS6_9FIRM|nr:hypothetical protein [Wansuia hejianensis]MBC8590465.1 hypothetical protein [Wansuia hejianensis]
MRRQLFRHRNKMQKVIGISLSAIGFLIVINVISVRFLLLLIGVGLLLIGTLIFMK